MPGRAISITRRSSPNRLAGAHRACRARMRHAQLKHGRPLVPWQALDQSKLNLCQPRLYAFSPSPLSPPPRGWDWGAGCHSTSQRRRAGAIVPAAVGTGAAQQVAGEGPTAWGAGDEAASSETVRHSASHGANDEIAKQADATDSPLQLRWTVRAHCRRRQQLRRTRVCCAKRHTPGQRGGQHGHRHLPLAPDHDGSGQDLTGRRQEPPRPDGEPSAARGKLVAVPLLERRRSSRAASNRRR